MRATSETAVTIDSMPTTIEVAEVAKAAMKFGYRMVQEQYVSDGGTPMTQAHMTRTEPAWLSEELACLVFLQALAAGHSVDKVLTDVRLRLERWHVPIDRPPSDEPGIGELHPDGHPE